MEIIWKYFQSNRSSPRSSVSSFSIQSVTDSPGNFYENLRRKWDIDSSREDSVDGISEKILRQDGVEICGYFLRGKMNRLVKTEKILTSSRVHDMPIGFKVNKSNIESV